MNEYDKEFEKAGLINLQQLDSSIIADLKYATTDNFVGKKLYPQKFGIYLEPTLAYAVANASRLLRQMLPHTRIVVFDAARPLSVQQKMF